MILSPLVSHPLSLVCLFDVCSFVCMLVFYTLSSVFIPEFSVTDTLHGAGIELS